jgi:porphobilinogen synthase
MSSMSHRPRRLRRTSALRRLVRETVLSPDRFVYPLFAQHGRGVRDEVASMPGVHRQSVDRLVEDAHEAFELGIPAVLLFGLPLAKDAIGSPAAADDGPVPAAIRELKRVVPGMVVIADVCLCEYTDHGHCGLIEGEHVANDATLPHLAAAATCYARAGADVVAPSDMMDGRVAAIRAGLDAAGHSEVAILSYAAKYCSAFYGPFRDAADSAPKFGDRRTYQMDPPNVREALREVELDLEEGADWVMVKPALAYLDVIRAVRERCDVPLAAYQVSGEYSMIHAAARLGWIDKDRAMFETLYAIVRAGADQVLTYFAKDAAAKLRRGDLPF